MPHYYVIRQLSTGKFLPLLRKKRGYTHTEPMSTSEAVPRMHLTLKSARLALYAWLQGTWEDEYSYTDVDGPNYEGPAPTKVPGRNKEDMEIVKVYITL